ncbi:protein RecA [Striga asiatica]|uniref:Protein RecA n=1 Tax=Striga asiatica TaxID=4170 RepID=A0A5A7QVD0_STRAF|nr:protein RecA [Striga asiatica]
MPQGNVEYPPSVFGSREREYRHQLIDEAVSVTRVEKDKILSVYTRDGNKPKGPSFFQAEGQKERTRRRLKGVIRCGEGDDLSGRAIDISAPEQDKPFMPPSLIQQSGAHLPGKGGEIGRIPSAPDSPHSKTPSQPNPNTCKQIRLDVRTILLQ